ncbi:MAG: class I SAM-dependent methyltransferase [Bacteroidota bacterium]|nr:class I SAM-dependent methyltransferase [Bacteroidota bacterium]
MTNKNKTIAGSFRDPSGFLFNRDGILYRQINHVGVDDYELTLSSGLYDALVEKKLLIPHQEVDIPAHVPEIAYKIIQPEQVQFISYPYEWCFSQLKHAALATLKIQRLAMQHGMSLKDSSAYNIQFNRGRPTLIDTLSFERYQPGEPWVAYRQFCQHFLAPLALMAHKDVRLISLLRTNIDGIPLDLASKLLPKRTSLVASLLMHLHLHAKSMRMSASKSIDRESVSGKMSETSLVGLIDSLQSGINRLNWDPGGTDWADYYDQTNYTANGFESKKQIVAEFLDRTRANMVWDLGANTGVFSHLATEAGKETISFDLDPAAVEKNYRICLKEKNPLMFPLVMDLTNPSPSLGWHNNERESLLERGPADAVLALALIHHLVIGNNLPMRKVAQFLRDTGQWLIIEFIPKEDSQVQKMLSLRVDIFQDYRQENFERAFKEHFRILDVQHVVDSGRRIYLMQVRSPM